MNALEKNLVDSYFALLENLSISAKTELVERLKISLKKKKNVKPNDSLEKSFGSWKSPKTPQEIISEINEDLLFTPKSLDL